MKKPKIVLFIACTLDGYIATEDHHLEWLFEVQGEGDNGYSEFYRTIDTVVMGRTTYDWIIKQENGNYPYAGKAGYVFSRTRQGDNGHVSYIRDIPRFLEVLPGSGTVWLVGGGELIAAFLSAGLVDEMTVTVAPVLLGNGIPLFPQIDSAADLHLESISRYGQFAELRYRVIRRNTE